MNVESAERLKIELRAKVRDVFALQSQGAGPTLQRAQGYVDGYMTVLLDSGLATKGELLQLVIDERERAWGPGTKDLALVSP